MNARCAGLRGPPAHAAQRELSPRAGAPTYGTAAHPWFSFRAPRIPDPPKPLLMLPPAGGEHSSLGYQSNTEYNLRQGPQPPHVINLQTPSPERPTFQVCPIIVQISKDFQNKQQST